MKLLGHMVVLFWAFGDTSILFSIVAAPIVFPQIAYKGSLFSTSSSTFVTCVLFDNSCSERCEVISHCSFNLHFSNNEQRWASFHVFVCHMYVFFGEMSFYIFGPFFFIGSFIFLELSCRCCLYIFEINPLFVASFAIISPNLRAVFSRCL